MNLCHKHLGLNFLLCCFTMLLSITLFPGLPLLYFSPFLVIVIYKKELPKALWIGLCTGLLLDLLDSHPRLPLHAAAFTAATWIVYPQKKHFFSDLPSTMPIMTTLFSFCYTAVYFSLISFCETSLNLSISSAATDFLILPVADGAFAYTLFILPFLIFGKRRLKGRDYFLN